MTSFAIPEPFQWDSSFDVKNDLFNDQHKKLFTLIAELAANKSDSAKLTALLELVQVHFKSEEDTFAEKKWDAGKATAHKAIHDKFVADAVAATKNGVSDEVITFLKNWLVTHIMGSDMDYVGSL